MNISQKVEALRKQKGWSVAQLARETDIPTVSLRVMLKRDNGNNWNTLPLQKIAEVLGVTVSYLTSNEEDNNEKPMLSEEQYAQLQKKLDEAIRMFFRVPVNGNEPMQELNEH